jgi:pyruvate,water dikinase
VDDPRRADGTTGKILIARSTDPGWVFLMLCSKGIVVEKGSVLSHTAIIGRELGIPTIVGVKNATRIIPTGSQIRIDGGKGVIRWN